VSVLRRLKEVVDIYLPDFKYGDDKISFKYSKVKHYSRIAFLAIKEMLRQKGKLEMEKNGLAQKGVIVRHLILPNNLENSYLVLDKLSLLDLNLYISLLGQYVPCYEAKNFPEINRELTKEEFNNVLQHFLELGFHNGWIQEPGKGENLVPDFTKSNPFSV